MRVLFIGNNFPPEVNALATRLYEHARQWAKEGGEVIVMTDVPNFPEGVVYDGYRNRYTEEVIDGIEVVRVPMYVTKNEGTVRRILSFISFMISAIWYSRKIKGEVDIVVASSPQFFSAIAGYLISKLKSTPFVLEVRDLWPESIVAVGAMSRNRIIRFFEKIEYFLYRKADHIVVVTNAFKRIIVSRGIQESKVSVFKNGVDLRAFSGPIDEQKVNFLRKKHGLEGKFVASYIGTVGMAHRVDTLFDAAKNCTNEDVVFLVVGTGAARKAIEERLYAEPLDNFILIEKQPRAMIRYWLALSDASIVHLKNSPLFRTVIPSKIFEAMVMQKPIMLGVDGETRELIEEAEAGLYFTPEDPGSLLARTNELYQNPGYCRLLGFNGKVYVDRYHNRARIAAQYWELLDNVAAGEVPTRTLASEFVHP